MNSLFFWEIGTPWVYIMFVAVLLVQIIVAEINRRWNWTIFVVWTLGGLLLIPYTVIYSTPMVGWFPFGKYVIMVATATMTGTLLVYGKRYPIKAHRYAIWLGVALWIGLAANIMEANIRDITIFFQADHYYACAANWQCLKSIDAAHTITMIPGLPETRGVQASFLSDAWYQEVAQNFAKAHVGIDPETGFRTIGGWWNLMSAAAGILNIITITGIGKIFITSNPRQKVRGLIWIDMVWPWVIAYDLWNFAFLYNALADYTWYCAFALLLACTIPAFTWAKGQWIWFRCFTLMFWIAVNNWFPLLLVRPNSMFNYASMNPWANIVASGAALVFNLGIFAYWLYKIVTTKRNPITGVLYCELKEFQAIAREHADEKDKWFLTDAIAQTPAEINMEPALDAPPVDGWVSYMPWWKQDRRFNKPRVPLAADPVVDQKYRTRSKSR